MRKKQTVPSAQKKIDLKHSGRNGRMEKITLYHLKLLLTQNLEEFQYNLLNNIFFTSEKLFRFKVIESPLCAFCKTEIESSEHFFFFIAIRQRKFGICSLLG